ncbi:MAG: hypothetical protein ABSB00_00770 [Minisyncoccia bacterium]|jgi:hypothetical protein
MASITFSKEEFDAVKAKAEADYKKVGEVQCPYLNSKIAFNAKGLDHIKMKKWNHARSKDDQFMRLKLLHLAPSVLKESHTLQGIDQGNKMERIKINSRWEFKMVFVSYYDFISVISGCRIRIVVKNIENGPNYFWSIIPYWKQGNYRREMFEGNPEED